MDVVDSAAPPILILILGMLLIPSLILILIHPPSPPVRPRSQFQAGSLGWVEQREQRKARSVA